MTTPESLKIKQARQQILRNLDMVYPSGMIVANLYQTVCAIDEMYDFNLFRKDCVYLKDKGYVVFIDDAIGGIDEFRKRAVKLSCEGKEIAERTQTDPALEI